MYRALNKKVHFMKEAYVIYFTFLIPYYIIHSFNKESEADGLSSTSYFFFIFVKKIHVFSMFKLATEKIQLFAE